MISLVFFVHSNSLQRHSSCPNWRLHIPKEGNGGTDTVMTEIISFRPRCCAAGCPCVQLHPTSTSHRWTWWVVEMGGGRRRIGDAVCMHRGCRWSSLSKKPNVGFLCGWRLSVVRPHLSSPLLIAPVVWRSTRSSATGLLLSQQRLLSSLRRHVTNYRLVKPRSVLSVSVSLTFFCILHRPPHSLWAPFFVPPLAPLQCRETNVVSYRVSEWEREILYV